MNWNRLSIKRAAMCSHREIIFQSVGFLTSLINSNLHAINFMSSHLNIIPSLLQPKTLQMLPENNIDYIHIIIVFNGSQTLFFFFFFFFFCRTAQWALIRLWWWRQSLNSYAPTWCSLVAAMLRMRRHEAIRNHEPCRCKSTENV